MFCVTSGEYEGSKAALEMIHNIEREMFNQLGLVFRKLKVRYLNFFCNFIDKNGILWRGKFDPTTTMRIVICLKSFK